MTLSLETTGKAGKSIKVISLKAWEIYQGKEDQCPLPGQCPGKTERKHKDVRPEVKVYFPPQDISQEAKQKVVSTRPRIWELSVVPWSWEDKSCVQIYRRGGAWQILFKFSFVTPKGITLVIRTSTNLPISTKAKT